MRRATRIPQSLQSLALRPQSTSRPFICRACTQRAASTTSEATTEVSSDNIPAKYQPTSRKISETWTDNTRRWSHTGKILPKNESDEPYVPATRADGLQVVGTDEWVENLRSKDLEYTGFMNREKAETESQIRAAMVQAVGSVKGKGESFARSASPEKQIKALHDFDLSSPEVKFQVIKDFMRHSGIRVSDNIITHSQTAGALYHRIVTQPKEEKVFEKITNGDKGRVDLRALPNVRVFEKKRQVNDKEREIGRLKVIERELRERNLA